MKRLGRTYGSGGPKGSSINSCYGIHVTLEDKYRTLFFRPLCSRALQLFSGLHTRQIAETLAIGSGAAVSKQLRL